jgi:hypothetical protein
MHIKLRISMSRFDTFHSFLSLARACALALWRVFYTTGATRLLCKTLSMSGAAPPRKG